MTWARAEGLTDRRSEREALDRLVQAVTGGQSQALVVRGDPGVGKTVLLDYLARRASGCQVARASGVQSEMELAGLVGAVAAVPPGFDRHAAAFTGGRCAHDVLLGMRGGGRGGGGAG